MGSRPATQGQLQGDVVQTAVGSLCSVVFGVAITVAAVAAAVAVAASAAAVAVAAAIVSVFLCLHAPRRYCLMSYGCCL